MAWAATRLRAGGRAQPVIYAAYDPQDTGPTVRVLRFAVRLGERRCSRGQRRCARVAFVAVRTDADARVSVASSAGGFPIERFAPAGRTVTVRLVLPAGRIKVSLVVPTLVGSPSRTVTVG